MLDELSKNLCGVLTHNIKNRKKIYKDFRIRIFLIEREYDICIS